MPNLLVSGLKPICLSADDNMEDVQHLNMERPVVHCFLCAIRNEGCSALREQPVFATQLSPDHHGESNHDPRWSGDGSLDMMQHACIE